MNKKYIKLQILQIKPLPPYQECEANLSQL